jgi:hypothetical protein
MHILASGPELQAVRFGYVILGKKKKKKEGQILKKVPTVHSQHSFSIPQNEALTDASQSHNSTLASNMSCL